MGVGINPNLNYDPLNPSGTPEEAKANNNFGYTDPTASDWYEYQHGSIKLRTPNPMTDEEVNAWAQRNIETGMYNPEQDAKQEYHRNDLLKDENLLNSYKRYWAYTHSGQQFEGSNSELLDDYYTHMRWLENNTAAMAKLALDLNGNQIDNETRQAVKTMYSTWDNTASSFSDDWANNTASLTDDPIKFFQNFSNSGQAILDHTISNVIDPINIAFMTTGGLVGKSANVAMRKLLQEGALKGVENHITQKVIQEAGSKAIQGATEGVISGLVKDSAKQNIDQSLGNSDGWSPMETFSTVLGNAAMSAGMMGTFGAGKGLLKGVQDVRASNKVIEALANSGLSEDEMAKIKAGKYSAEELNGLLSGQYGIDELNSMKPKNVKNSDALRRLKDAIAFQGEEDYQAALKAGKDMTGYERKANRELANQYYKTLVGSYMEDKYNNPISYKTVSGTETSIGDLFKPDNVRAFMEHVGVTTDDSFTQAFDKVIKFQPTAATDNALGIRVPATVQKQAILQSMMDKSFTTLQEAADGFHPDLDRTRLTNLAIKSRDEIFKQRSSGSWMLNLAKADRDVPKWNYSAQQFENLTPPQQAMLTEVIGKAKDWDEATKVLNGVTAFTSRINPENANTLPGGAIADAKGVADKATRDYKLKSEAINFFHKVNSANAYNLLSNWATIGRNTVQGVYKFGMDMAQEYIGGSAEQREIVKQQAKALLDYNQFKAGAQGVMDTFLTAKGRINRSYYNDLAWQGAEHDYDLSRIGESFMEHLNNPDLTKFQQIRNTAEDVSHNFFTFMGKRMMITSDEAISQLGLRTRLQGELVAKYLERNTGGTPEVSIKMAQDRSLVLAYIHQMQVSNKENYQNQLRKNAQGHSVLTYIDGKDILAPGGEEQQLLDKLIKEYVNPLKFQTQTVKGLDIGALTSKFKNASNLQDLNPESSSWGDIWTKGVPSMISSQLAPFIRTPTAIFNYSLEHTPGLQSLSARYRETLAAPATDAVARGNQARMLGGTFMGGVMWAHAMMQAFEGNLEGGDTPGSYQTGAVGKAQFTDEQGNLIGRKPTNTLNWHGTKINLDAMNPIMMPYKIMADVADIYKYGGTEAGMEAMAALQLHYGDAMISNTKFAKDILEKNFGNIMNIPGLTGIRQGVKLATDLGTTLSDSATENKMQAAKDRLGKQAGSSLVNMFPGTGYFGWFSDDVHRDAHDFITEIKRKVPGLNKELGFNRDPVSGQIMKFLPSYEAPVLPFDVKVGKMNDPVNKELLNQAVAVPKISYLVEGIDTRNYKQENGVPYFDKLQDNISKVRLDGGEFNGLTLYQALTKLVQSPDYVSSRSQMTYFPKTSEGNRTAPVQTNKQGALNYVIQQYHEAAKAAMSEEIVARAKKGDAEAKRMMNDARLMQAGKEQPSVVGL